MTAIDWTGLMRAACLGLGLRPAEFWALTPAELALLMGTDGQKPLTQDGLEALVTAYPDKTGAI